MIKISVLLGCGAISAAIASACSSSPETPCSRVVLLPEIPSAPQLLYPAPNASGVPTEAGDFIIGVDSGAPRAYAIALFVGGGSALSLAAPVPVNSAVPTPLASPRDTIEKLYAVSHPKLQPHANYRVTFSRSRLGPCDVAEHVSDNFVTR